VYVWCFAPFSGVGKVGEAGVKIYYFTTSDFKLALKFSTPSLPEVGVG